MKWSLCRSILLLALSMSLAACRGPDPTVVRQELRPPLTPNDPYTLVVTIENRSGGEGQAEVIARLRSKATHETAAETSQSITLQPYETVQMMLELRPSAIGDYDATVEAQYPQE
jgi:hypothetical protein